ncbi:MAG: hypothetical protein J2O46_11025 [Nocardioides sp.]|nr:hypothetical protein [Nocardioides sp.]
MAKYLITLYEPPSGPPDTADLPQIIADATAVSKEAEEAGVWVFGGGLTPAAEAVTVTPGEGDPVVTDGPYLEAKEYLGGFSLVDVPDLETAVSWAKKLAVACRCAQEVRGFGDGSEAQ